MSYDKEKLNDNGVTEEEIKKMVQDLEGEEMPQQVSTEPKVKVIRTLVHNKRMAPSGTIFLVATSLDKKNELKYSMYKLIQTGLSDESEQTIKLQLAADLVAHFKL